MLAAGLTATAQSNYHNQSTWLSLNNDAALYKKYALHFEGHFRMVHTAGTRMQMFIIRPGITYFLRPKTMLTTGVGWLYHYPYGARAAAFPFLERQVFQQINSAHKLGKLTLVHRGRFEQRWLNVMQASPQGGDPEVLDLSFQPRLRYRALVFVPLGKQPSSLRLLAGNEVFLNFVPPSYDPAFLQNRAMMGLMRPFKGGHFVSMNYIHQFLRQPAAQYNYNNHTLQLLVVINKRPKEVEG